MQSPGKVEPELDALTTEVVDPQHADIDSLNVLERLQVINVQDKLVAVAVERELKQIASAVSLIVASFKNGGRLIYVGAGTSGRLGVLDASECPPTFGTQPSMVNAVIAGGKGAMFEAVEGAEDDEIAGEIAVLDLNVADNDTVVGISASGQAPFVYGALLAAKAAGASTVVVSNNRPCRLETIASVTIAPIVGPEVIAGSTRMKAGTAQKMVLNMLTTCSMIEIGKTFGNRMVDVRATNTKLRARALRMTMEITGVNSTVAEAALAGANGQVKLAVTMIATGRDAKFAAQLLEHNGGVLRKALITSKELSEAKDSSSE